MTCGVNDNVAASKLLVTVNQAQKHEQVWIKWHIQQVVYLSLAETICVAMQSLKLCPGKVRRL